MADRTTDTKTAIAALAGLRALLGAALLVAPGRVGRPWFGESVTGNRAARAALRSLGARDALLGVGALLALREDAPVRGWLEAGAAADASDLLASLAGGGALPLTGRRLVPVMSASAAALGGWLARRP